MKHPPSAHPPRPSPIGRRIPRSRTEAAVDLVRVEFQRARLERELADCHRRQTAAAAGLRTSIRRADALLARLSAEDPRPGDGGDGSWR